MMANGWKGKLEMLKDYDLSSTALDQLKQECLASDYADAIVIVGSKVYFIEDRFQEFLIVNSAKSQNKKDAGKASRRIRKLHASDEMEG